MNSIKEKMTNLKFKIFLCGRKTTSEASQELKMKDNIMRRYVDYISFLHHYYGIVCMPHL